MRARGTASGTGLASYLTTSQGLTQRSGRVSLLPEARPVHVELR